MKKKLDFDDILSKDEQKTLITQLGKGQGEFSEDDVLTVFNWASRIAVEKALLDQVLEGKLKIRVDENSEIMFQK